MEAKKGVDNMSIIHDYKILRSGTPEGIEAKFKEYCRLGYDVLWAQRVGSFIEMGIIGPHAVMPPVDIVCVFKEAFIKTKDFGHYFEKMYSAGWDLAGASHRKCEYRFDYGKLTWGLFYKEILPD